MLASRMTLTRAQVAEMFEMEVTHVPTQQGPTTQDNIAELAAFKERLKKHYRTLAKKYHPDVGGDEEKMKLINRVYDVLMALKPRCMEPSVTIITSYSSWGTSFTHSWVRTSTT